MKGRIRIGAGNRKHALFQMGVNLLVLISFLVFSLLNENAIYFFLLVVGIVLVECIRISCRNYVSFENAEFVIESVFREKARIKAELFKSVDRPMIGTSIPFSNEMIITFRNGLKFRFSGGIQRRKDVEDLIKNLVSEVGKLR